LNTLIRFNSVLLLAVGIGACATGGGVDAQTPQARVAAQESNFAKDEVDTALESANRFLLANQREDGAITDRQYDTTMTALAIMALASTGNTPSTPSELGEASRKALAFVLREDRQDKDGYYGNKDGSRMYGHGIITLMLTEMLGMGADAEQDQLIEARGQSDFECSKAEQAKPIRRSVAIHSELERFRSVGKRLAVDGTAIGQE
jgi:hypothetical protein